MIARFVRSPNVDRRTGPPDMVVLHYTDMVSAEAALGWLINPESRVSAHYLVSASGEIVQMVAEADRAWHAGVSHWAGVDRLNNCSIGIELDNPGHRPDPPVFPAPQIDALINLLDGIRSRWQVPAHRVLAHSDIAPSRKIDPGEGFPWKRLAHHGHAIHVDAQEISPAFDRTRFDRALAAAGYGIPDDDEGYEALVTAFHRRHRPGHVTAVPDAVSLAIAEAFADAVRRDAELCGSGGAPATTAQSPIGALPGL